MPRCEVVRSLFPHVCNCVCVIEKLAFGYQNTKHLPNDNINKDLRLLHSATLFATKLEYRAQLPLIVKLEKKNLHSTKLPNFPGETGNMQLIHFSFWHKGFFVYSNINL